MTVKYGFYDSLNGDRLYNANDINTFFEGVFSDGVFEFVGNALEVTNDPGTMNILVKDGRAYFNNLWLRNTTTLSLPLQPSSLIYDRIDVVILEFDSNITVRENSIKILTGTPSSTPVPPVLVHNSNLNQYALAHVYVSATVSEIFIENITNKIGTINTPYAQSILSPTYVLPVATPTTIGGVKRNTGSAGQYVTGISSIGDLEYDTPVGGSTTWNDVGGTFTPLSQAYTNDPAAGKNIVLNMTNTSNFEVGNAIAVYSGTGSEQTTIGALTVNTNITASKLVLNHNTVNRLVVAYAVSTSIDLTASIKKGYKIRFTQDGIIKCFYVASITSTKILFIGNSDYLPSTNTITNPQFSTENDPFGFPNGGFLNFATSHIRSTVDYTNEPTSNTAQYKVVGDMIEGFIDFTIITTNDGSGICRFKLPFWNPSFGYNGNMLGVEQAVTGASILIGASTLYGIGSMFMIPSGNLTITAGYRYSGFFRVRLS